MSYLVSGTFNAENFWRDSNFAQLPFSITNPLNELTVKCLDELLWVFLRDEKDILLTQFKFNSSLKKYLCSIGFELNTIFLSENSEVDNVHINVFESLIDNFHQFETFNNLKNNIELLPFAVIPGCDQLAAKLDKTNTVKFPDQSIIKTVNSKVYSSKFISEYLVDKAYSSIHVESVKEFVEVSKSLLSKSAILLKDPFGVSGKGNLLIEKNEMVAFVERHLLKQEKLGKKISFIIEPFYNKKFDFSCQLYLSKEGDFRILSTCILFNNGFNYSGTQLANETFVNELKEKKYYECLEVLIADIHKKGYYGDISVDSMYLTNETIIPVVEVNCRKSMSSIFVSLKSKISKLFGLQYPDFLTTVNLSIPREIDFDSFLRMLELDDMLFSKEKREGVILLSANTFDSNRHIGNDTRYVGRLYLYVVSKFDPSIELLRFKELLKKYSILSLS